MNTATQLLERCRKNLLQQFASQGDCDEDLLKNIEAYLKKKQECNPHPDAPHGFSRNASHNEGRYVCECEGWSEDEIKKARAAGIAHAKEECAKVAESTTYGEIDFLSPAEVHIMDMTAFLAGRHIRNLEIK